MKGFRWSARDWESQNWDVAVQALPVAAKRSSCVRLRRPLVSPASQCCSLAGRRPPAWQCLSRKRALLTTVARLQQSRNSLERDARKKRIRRRVQLLRVMLERSQRVCLKGQRGRRSARWKQQGRRALWCRGRLKGLSNSQMKHQKGRRQTPQREKRASRYSRC